MVASIRLLAFCAALAVACSDDVGAPPVQASGTANDGGTEGGGGACRNGQKDGDETDVDCGGAACPPCANGQSCKDRRDCFSALCLVQVCNQDVGCSDGSREGFVDGSAFTNIAACSGGWSIPGLLADTTKTQACNGI